MRSLVNASARLAEGDYSARVTEVEGGPLRDLGPLSSEGGGDPEGRGVEGLSATGRPEQQGGQREALDERAQDDQIPGTTGTLKLYPTPMEKVPIVASSTFTWS